VLLFVFRDRTKTPLERLVETWGADLGRMWQGITKPPQYEGASLADFFDLRYAALSNYEDRQEEFLAESVLLRRQFAGGDDAGAGRACSATVPGTRDGKGGGGSSRPGLCRQRALLPSGPVVDGGHSRPRPRPPRPQTRRPASWPPVRRSCRATRWRCPWPRCGRWCGSTRTSTCRRTG
jgi:hypothetical protein